MEVMPAFSRALSIVRDPAEGLAVPPPLSARWAELPPPLRRHLASFLAPARPADPPGALAARVAAAPTAPTAPGPPGSVPASFLEDLAAGGPHLRAAFPNLVRRLASIDGADPLVVRVTCEGAHDGPFFGFMLPTNRRIRFDELHHLTLARDGAADVRVAIDFRAIVRQLAGGS